MNATWQALAREAASAAEHMAFGVTVLGRANYAQHAYYAQAFFSLSIGFERCGKIALVVDHALENDGAFPPSHALKDYGHKLKELVDHTDEIAKKRQIEAVRPSSTIHDGIMEALSDFATNLTRYYNLELLASNAAVAVQGDPIEAWFERVTKPILDAHYQQRYRERHARNARLVEALVDGFALVRHHTEEGEEINTVYEGAALTGAAEFARPWERMYVMQIARFMAIVVSELGLAAQMARLKDVPYLSEFFAIFRNDDAYFRGRKTWSIYP